jgi:tetratricopeptide (TPR) repeat protein
MKLDQNDPKYLQSMRLYLLGDWKAANEAFLELEKTYSDSAFIQLLLGNIQYSLGQLDKSVHYYERAIERKSDFGNAYYKLGVCLYRMGKLNKALDAFKTLLDMEDQSHAMAAYFVALITMFLGQNNEATNGFEILKNASPDSKIANFYLAYMKIKEHKWDEAVELLTELIEVTPNFAEVHYMLGQSYFALHKNIKALEAFKKALELNPEDTRAKSKIEVLTDVQWP